MKRIAEGVATLLLSTYRAMREAEALGSGMPPDPIRALAVQFAGWCRDVATPGVLSAGEAGLRGIGFLFAGDKELKRLKQELTFRIMTLNRQVQIRGCDQRRWPLRVYSEEVVTNDRGGAPKKKGGRPPKAGLLERCFEIARMVESMEMTWQEGCDAYERQYGTKVKPGTVQRWLRRNRTKLPQSDAA